MQRSSSALPGISRREILSLIGVAGMTGLAGCCQLKDFAKPSNLEPRPHDIPLRFGATRWRGSPAPKGCFDAHAHFFNASDVTVAGYLGGPIANDMGEPIATLIRLLVPFAQFLSEAAPSAKGEYEYLIGLSKSPLMALDVEKRREDISDAFYKEVKKRGQEFEAKYNEIVLGLGEHEIRALGGQRPELFNSKSLHKAMTPDMRRSMPMSAQERQTLAAVPYPEGVLAFVGYMLSYRHENLKAYQHAYTTSPEAFGVEHVAGAMVDFEHWLDCAPRSAQEDQIRVMDLISRMSGGYMRPLVAYNPWSDVVSGGQARERVKEAVKKYSCIGAKIYPPNGFRPYGNTYPIANFGEPKPEELNDALKKFWDMCVEEGISVLAHAGKSMGKDSKHTDMAGPEGWADLLKMYPPGKGPRVDVGHFGGDKQNTWTALFAQQMHKYGTVYADVSYWTGLKKGVDSDAYFKLMQALEMPDANKRVMFGTDWLMLSMERDWFRFPYDLDGTVRSLGESLISREDFFSSNAASFFCAEVLSRPAYWVDPQYPKKGTQ